MSTECYDDEAEVSRLEKELLHLCNKVERISNNFKDLIDEEYHLKIVTDEKEKIVLPNIYIDDYDLEQPKRDYVSSMRKRTSHGSYDYVCSDDDKREKPIANRYVGPEMINTDIQYTQLFQNQLIIKYNTLMRGYIVHVDSPYSFYVRLKNSSYETDFVDDKLFSKCQQPNSSLFYNQSESICSASNIPSCSYMENTRFHTKSCDNQSFLKQIKYFYEGPDCLCRPLKNARLNQICVVRVNLQTNGIFDPDIANMEICYYRGFVTKIDKANQLYEVFLIDHGGKVTVTWQDVLEFSYHFFKQKSLIFSCFLDYDLYKHDITEYNKRLHILMLKNICIRIKFRFEYTEYNHYFQKQIPAQIRFRLNFQEGFDLLIDSFSEYFGNYFNYKCDDYQSKQFFYKVFIFKINCLLIELFADFISSNPEYSIDKDTLSNCKDFINLEVSFLFLFIDYRAFSLKFPQYESKEFQGNLFPVKVIWKRAKRFEFACIHIDRQLDYFTSYLWFVFIF